MRQEENKIEKRRRGKGVRRRKKIKGQSVSQTIIDWGNSLLYVTTNLTRDVI